MTEREMLEWAAKAAGVLTKSWYGNHAYIDGMLSRWNPLTDDGDALRLAVKLGLKVLASCGFNEGNKGAGVSRNDEECEPIPEFWTAHENDPCAATRHSIVRAAAEIGRSKHE